MCHMIINTWWIKMICYYWGHPVFCRRIINSHMISQPRYIVRHGAVILRHLLQPYVLSFQAKCVCVCACARACVCMCSLFCSFSRSKHVFHIQNKNSIYLQNMSIKEITVGLKLKVFFFLRLEAPSIFSTAICEMSFIFFLGEIILNHWDCFLFDSKEVPTESTNPKFLWASMLSNYTWNK